MSRLMVLHMKSIKLYEFLGVFFLFLTMFFPDSYRSFRLLIFAAFVLLCAKKSDFKLTGAGSIILLIFIISNVFFCVWGIITGAPGALRTQTVDVLWPVMFWFAAQILYSDDMFRKLARLLLSIELIICLFDVIYILTWLNVIPHLPFFNILEDALQCNFGHYGNYTQYTTTHMCTHIFMIPFTIALFFSQNKNAIIKRRNLFIMLILEFVCVLLSGRVAFQLVSAVSIFITMGVMWITNKRKSISWKFIRRVLLIAVGLIVVGIMVMNLFEVDIDGVMHYINYKFESSADAANTTNGVRIIQKDALISGWLESPLIGHGAGSYSKDVVRDIGQPWAYEYSYYAMLFQKGIVGVAIYFGVVAWIIIRLIKLIKNGACSKDWAVPMIVGLIAILIANAADPYLNKFGCMWMLYIPFAAANNIKFIKDNKSDEIEEGSDADESMPKGLRTYVNV